MRVIKKCSQQHGHIKTILHYAAVCPLCKAETRIKELEGIISRISKGWEKEDDSLIVAALTDMYGVEK